MQTMEQSIRERAYHLWASAGRPDGNADAFWLNAQRDMLAESLGQIATVKTSSKAAISDVVKPDNVSKAKSPRKRKAA